MSLMYIMNIIEPIFFETILIRSYDVIFSYIIIYSFFNYSISILLENFGILYVCNFLYYFYYYSHESISLIYYYILYYHIRCVHGFFKIKLNTRSKGLNISVI